MTDLFFMFNKLMRFTHFAQKPCCKNSLLSPAKLIDAVTPNSNQII